MVGLVVEIPGVDVVFCVVGAMVPLDGFGVIGVLTVLVGLIVELAVVGGTGVVVPFIVVLVPLVVWAPSNP